MSYLLRKNVQLRKLCKFSYQRFSFLKSERRFTILRNTNKNFLQNHVFQQPCRLFAVAAHKYELSTDQLNRGENFSLSIDESLSKIDFEAKRYGRIYKKDVENVLAKIVQKGSATPVQSLYLIRCCGEFMRELLPAKRTELANEIWNRLSEMGVAFDASHYNSLLKVYLDNKHVFCPTTFLSNMENKGVTPNRVTYQRLIEQFCVSGDLSGASAVLEFMKEKEIAINEGVFNSLIKGHAKANDFDGAKNMLEVMRKSHLVPSADSYCVLACSFAENGKIDEVKSILKEAENRELYISDSHLLQIISSLAISDYAQYVDEFLSKVTNINEYKEMFLNTALDLVNEGKEDVAYKMILYLADSQAPFNGSSFFIAQLVWSEKPYETVLKYCHLIKNERLNENVFSVAAKCFLEGGYVDNALKLFVEMQKQGVPVRCHYFWPIFVTYGKQRNAEGVWKTLSSMYQLGINADSDTYIDYVFPNVSVHDPELVVKNLKEAGLTEMAFMEPLFHYYCNVGDLENAAYLCKNFTVQLNAKSSLKSLASCYKPSNEYDEIYLQILERLSETSGNTDLCGKLFLTLIANKNLSESLVNKAYSKGLYLSPVDADAIYERLKDNAPNLARVIRSMASGRQTSLPKEKESAFVHPRDMTIEELEASLIEYKNKGLNTKGVLIHMLTYYCRSKNLNRVVEIKAELEELGFVFSPASYALLINLFVSFNNLEEASKLKRKLNEEYPDFKLDTVKIIEYSNLLIKENRIEEALQVLQQDCKSLDFPGNEEVVMRAIRKLLNSAVEKGDVELLNKLYDIVSQLNVDIAKNNMLEHSIQIHLVRNDIAKAIEEYKRCISTYHLFPYRNQLLKKCILKDDRESLQKVVDLTTMYGGKIVTLHELALAFIETGRIHQARKVIQTLGGKTDTGHLDFMCSRLFRQNKVSELEQLLSITKDQYHIDRDKLYFYLLQLYAQNNDYQKALELWNSIQEENVRPQIKTLRLLAEILTKNEQPVPFVVPDENSYQENDSTVSISEPDYNLKEKLIKSLENSIADEVIEALKQMKKGHVRSFDPETISKIMDLLAVKNCLKDVSPIVNVMSYALEKSHAVFRPLLLKHSSEGNLDVIKSLGDFLPDFALKNLNFNYFVNKAYVASGRQSELLDELESKKSTDKIFSVHGFYELLTSAPHLEERAVKLVKDYLEQENFDLPKKALWMYYFINEKYDKAEEMFKQNPVTFVTMEAIVSYVIKNIRNTKNCAMAEKLIEVVNNYNMKQNIKDRAYSCLLDVLVDTNKLSEAVKVIEDVKNVDIPLTKFNRTTLSNLKSALIEAKQPVPFEIPEDSSSSSDSD